MRNSPQRYHARRVRISRGWKAAEVAYGRSPLQNLVLATTYAWFADLANPLGCSGQSQPVLASQPSLCLAAMRVPNCLAMWRPPARTQEDWSYQEIASATSLWRG